VNPVDALRAGEAVVLPTETVYGLATLPTATARIFELKGRAPDVPLAVLCADPRQALALVDGPTEAVGRVARELWPGPLTLVLPRRPGLGYELGEPATTIGVRCPDHDLVRFIATQVGPIAVTSANLHGQPTPPTAVAVARLFGDGVAGVVDGGDLTGTPSTVVDATPPDPAGWRVLREGGVSLAAVLAAAAAG
jgi:tRNA threonylcarbamoyl adenosine modification protein (Sua5/YciO/YrdC/YwlC family)